MSAVVRFPANRATCVWLTREEAAWLVLAGPHGWLHGCYQDARADAAWLAENFGIAVRAPPTAINSLPRNTSIGDHTMTTEKKFEQKPNNGAMFRNTRKRSDTDADFFGNLDVEGRQFQISAWSKTAQQTGKKYLRLAIRLKTAGAAATDAPAANNPAADFNDDMPW
jgi:hypothetical protein